MLLLAAAGVTASARSAPTDRESPTALALSTVRLFTFKFSYA